MDNTQKIYDDYAKFNIPIKSVPEYKDPISFSKKIEIFTLLKETDIYYGNSLTCQQINGDNNA